MNGPDQVWLYFYFELDPPPPVKLKNFYFCFRLGHDYCDGSQIGLVQACVALEITQVNADDLVIVSPTKIQFLILKKLIFWLTYQKFVKIMLSFIA